MTLFPLIQNYAHYNAWTISKMIHWLRKQSSEQLSQEAPSSFPSVSQTLTHLLHSHLIYLSILEKTELVFPQDLSIAEGMERLIQASQRLADMVDELGEAGIGQLQSIHMGAIQGDFPIADIVLHCVNHCTYHRGQIITMGHQLGFSKAPNADFYRYRLSM